MDTEEIISWLRSDEGHSWTDNLAGPNAGYLFSVKEDIRLPSPDGGCTCVWCTAAGREYWNAATIVIWWHSLSCACEDCLYQDRMIGVAVRAHAVITG